MEPELAATSTIESTHSSVVNFTRVHSGDVAGDVDKTVRLFYAVRDGFRYDPYQIDLTIPGMKASTTLAIERGWCVSKAILLAACCRSLGIPARLGFADVRNHLSTERMRRRMRTDIFYWHGYTEIRLEGKWVKATPAFNKRLCEFLGVEPIEFDGKGDAIFQEYDRAGNVFMEYLHDYGAFDDVPYELFLDELDKHYPHLTNNPRFVTEELVYDFRR